MSPGDFGSNPLCLLRELCVANSEWLDVSLIHSRPFAGKNPNSAQSQISRQFIGYFVSSFSAVISPALNR